MINKKYKPVLIGLFLVCFGSLAKAELPKEQVYSLFNQANEYFREANAATNDSDKAMSLYQKAILNYEKIISDGQIHNSKLYYNLANAYFLKGDLGKAILNYVRAEELDNSDANIKKNLAFARSQRIDSISEKTQKRVLQTLFFWHYDFSIKTKFILSCIFFAAFCLFLTIVVWFGRTVPRIIAVVIFGILVLCFIVSVSLESYTRSGTYHGVITIPEVVARQGDGRNYPASFKEPLHEGTEFDLLEQRVGWFHIKLSDDSDAWIPDNSAELV